MNPNEPQPQRRRYLVVVVFALAMAWVESAVVFYLRTHIDRIEPYQTNPLPVVGGFGRAELVREFSTLVMLFAVGFLAARTWRARIGYMLIAFGAWDIFYYVFLKVMCGWPNSLVDWDILFLLPLPWWGPVLAPVLIATLMISWGTLAVLIEHNPPRHVSKGRIWLVCLTGVVVALYVFMADALRVSAHGVSAVREVLPVWFNWPLFLVALGLMSVPVAHELLHWKQNRRGANIASIAT
jgi:hypothetical protein